MTGVKFGDYHSFGDFFLILQPNWEIGSPEPKTEYIEIPGADGVLDISESFGEVKFNNRILKFTFKTIVKRSQFWDLFSIVENAINGKRLKITIDNDPEWFYVGRVKVSALTNEQNIGNIEIECDCEPYKYKQHMTIRCDTVTANSFLTYYNSRLSVIPTFNFSDATTIVFNGKEYSFEAGSTITSDIVFTEGKNVIKILSDCTITVAYQEGSL